MEVLERDGDVVADSGVKIVSGAHPMHHARTYHAAGIREHVAKGVFKAGIEKRRKRQRSAKRLLESKVELFASSDVLLARCSSITCVFVAFESQRARTI